MSGADAISAASTGGRVLIAGVGNVLRGDDGFGPAVIEALEAQGMPRGVQVREFGIGGMALVQELMEGYAALVIVDAVDRGDPPGAVCLLEPSVPRVDTLAAAEQIALAPDLHQTVPSRALLIASAMGTLPPRIWIVGCQPAETEELAMELSEAVRAAVPRAVEMIRGLLREFASLEL